MKASEKISLLRTEMKARGVDHLLVPSDDYHMSEYVSDFFRARAYLSGFTGSAGTHEKFKRNDMWRIAI